MNMLAPSRIIVPLLLASSLACRAMSLYDYQEALLKKFTVSRAPRKVQITACPRLLEVAFARHVQDADEKKLKRLDIWNAWLPIHRAMHADGYVFEIEFLLLDQNLDSGIEVDLSRDLRRLIRLENNKGEYALMYKLTGDRVVTLDFSSPRKKFTAYFNTRTEQGTSLLRPGIESISLRIGPIGEQIPETVLTWGVPLWYGDIPRPHELKSRFGERPIYSLMPYKSNIYHRVEFAPPVNKPAPAVPVTNTPARRHDSR